MPQPVIILVEPQMGENIGAAARVMSNFGLTRLRLVAPRDGWPNPKAISMAAHGSFVLEEAEVFSSLEEAIADINYLLATSAHSRDMEKREYRIEKGIKLLHKAMEPHSKVAVMFGCERSGLSNQQLTLADGIISIDTSPSNPSLNLAQAVAIIAYEIAKVSGNLASSKLQGKDSTRANKAQLAQLLRTLEERLIDSGFLAAKERQKLMMRNISNAIVRAELTEQEVQTMHGVLKSLIGKSPAGKK